MASKASFDRRHRERQGKWRARVRIDWVEYFLGYFGTKEEAEARENDFREMMREAG